MTWFSARYTLFPHIGIPASVSTEIENEIIGIGNVDYNYWCNTTSTLVLVLIT